MSLRGHVQAAAAAAAAAEAAAAVATTAALQARIAEQDKVVAAAWEEELTNGHRPRHFQGSVIRLAVFHRHNILCVVKTGSGKSAPPLLVARMRGGVGVCIVPLIPIGIGQTADAQSLCPGVDSYHVDQLSPVALNQLIKKLEARQSRADGRPVMLYVSPQMIVSKRVGELVVTLLHRGVVSVIAIDECHRFPLDAPAFRREFARCKPCIFDFLAKVDAACRPPVIAMTATMTEELLEEFKKVTGIEFDVYVWGDVSRRDISLRLQFSHQPLTQLKQFAQKHINPSVGGQWMRFIIYTNHKYRITSSLEEKLSKVVEEMHGDGHDVVALHSGVGLIEKMYLMMGELARWAVGAILSHGGRQTLTSTPHSRPVPVPALPRSSPPPAHPHGMLISTPPHPTPPLL